MTVVSSGAFAADPTDVNDGSWGHFQCEPQQMSNLISMSKRGVILPAAYRTLCRAIKV
jgi:hypothetical protein